MDALIQALKFRQQLTIAPWLASTLCKSLSNSLLIEKAGFEIVIPIPGGVSRQRERGFNQAVEIARPLARQLHLPLDTSSVSRALETTAQSRLPLKLRKHNLRNAFACREQFNGCSILVVDDVMTSGATLHEFARTLKKNGARCVTNCVVARALRFPL